jgi:hypothetical protein
MPHPIRYICTHELLPVVEAALAAQGYHIDVPMQHSVGGVTAMVMVRGTVSILFSRAPQSTLVELEVSGVAQAAAVQLLESLPVPLAKQPYNSTSNE